MGIGETVKAQIADYPRVHAARANLAVHLVAIPLYWAGLIWLVYGLVAGAWPWGLGGAAALATSVALQGWGHRREREASRPFTGPWNVLLRLTTEALIVFPRYVLTGGWARAWRGRG